MTNWETLAGYTCDASADGAERAIVTVEKSDQALQFCAHHFHQHEIILGAMGWVVTSDVRAELLKPDPVYA